MRLHGSLRFNPYAWLILAYMRLKVRFRNPTRSHGVARISRLTFDTDSAQLSGVTFGGELETLAGLGAADWYNGSEEFLSLFYYSLGLKVALWGGKICGAEMFLDPESSPYFDAHELSAAVLELTKGGRRHLMVSAQTTERDALAALGPPLHTDAFNDRIWHRFEFERFWCELDVDPRTRRVVRIELSEPDGED